MFDGQFSWVENNRHKSAVVATPVNTGLPLERHWQIAVVEWQGMMLLQYWFLIDRAWEVGGEAGTQDCDGSSMCNGYRNMWLWLYKHVQGLQEYVALIVLGVNLKMTRALFVCLCSRLVCNCRLFLDADAERQWVSWCALLCCNTCGMKMLRWRLVSGEILNLQSLGGRF